MSVSSVSACLCVCLWDTCTASLLVEPASGEAAAVSLSLGRGLQVPGTPGWVPAAGQEESELEWLEEAAALLTSTL